KPKKSVAVPGSRVDAGRVKAAKARAKGPQQEDRLAVPAPSGRFWPLKFYEELRHLGSGAFGAAVLVRRLRDGRRFVAKKCCVK
ncbi:unnamed protein product, partial [Polarella glacialis]